MAPVFATNGGLSGAKRNTSPPAASRSYNRIGSVDENENTFWKLKGWLSNLRITTGVAR
jgi:hypothetical protein